MSSDTMDNTSESGVVVEASYWNFTDWTVNRQNLHTVPIYGSNDLSHYYKLSGMNDHKIANIAINGNKQRYVIENSGDSIAKTLQGRVYSAIDIITGRRVIVKVSNKQLVHSHICRYGSFISEDIRQEARLLHSLCNLKHCDAGISQFVDFFEDSRNYYLVSEHGGTDMFSYVRDNHPQDQTSATSNNATVKLVTQEEWKLEMQYCFRMIVRAVYFLHVHCNIAHLDLSLENTVIDMINSNGTEDPVCRLIDFGLAKHFGAKKQTTQSTQTTHNTENNSKSAGSEEEQHVHAHTRHDTNNWKYNRYIGKTGYQSPEIRNIITFLHNLHKRGIIDIGNIEKLEFSNNGEEYDRLIPNFLGYDARGADVWALGVMLFVMLNGCQPWKYASKDDAAFRIIMNKEDGSGMKMLLREWECSDFTGPDAFDLLRRIFVSEDKRINIEQTLSHPFVRNAPRSLRKIAKNDANGAKTVSDDACNVSDMSANIMYGMNGVNEVNARNKIDNVESGNISADSADTPTD